MTAMINKGDALLDPRYFQLFSLSLFLILGLFVFHLDVTPGRAFTFLLTAAMTQFSFEFFRFRRISLCFRNLPSALITGLSLSLLLRTSHEALVVAAAFLAISSKFIFRLNEKHFLNPANFAIVIFLSLDLGWVSPGQWGQSFMFLALGSALGGLTTWRSLRLDVAICFFVTWACLHFSRAIYLGDPLSIPIHKLSTGSVILFSLFMITDPRSTPSHAFGRYLFACLVALFGWWGQSFWFKPDFLFYALLFMSLLTPLIDLLFPAQPFSWQHSLDYFKRRGNAV